MDSPLLLNGQDMHLKYQLSIGWDCVNRQGVFHDLLYTEYYPFVIVTVFDYVHKHNSMQ